MAIGFLHNCCLTLNLYIVSYTLLYMQICGIYQIENIINKKKYIGQSYDIHKRWKDHKSLLNRNKHHNHHLQNAWNKYGEKNFTFTIVEQCAPNKKNQKEQYWIKTKNTYNQGYNLDKGGKGVLGYRKGHYRVINKGTDKGHKRYQLVNPESVPIYTTMFKDEILQICTLLNDNEINEQQAIQNMKNMSIGYKYNNKLQQINLSDIVQLLKEGHTKKDIMALYSVGNTTFDNFLLNNNVQWKQLKQQADMEKIKDYDEKCNLQQQIYLGKTTDELCKIIHCTRPNLQLYKKSNNIKRKTSCNYNKTLHISHTNTGIRYVSLLSDGTYQYRRTHENPNNISRVNLFDLEQTVKKRDLKWIIDDEEKYLQTKQKALIDNPIGKCNKYDSFQKIEDNDLLFYITKGMQKGYKQSQVFNFLSKQYSIPYSHFNAYLLHKNTSWDNLYYYIQINNIQEHKQEIVLLFVHGYTQKYIRNKFHFPQKMFASFCRYNKYKTHNIKTKSNNNRIQSNQTGYYRVDKQLGKRYKNGFTYRYAWEENGKQRTLKSTDIKKLEEKVKKAGLKWAKVPIKC